MAYKVELSPGVFVDLDEGLEATDIKPEDREQTVEQIKAGEPTTEEVDLAENVMKPSLTEKVEAKTKEPVAEDEPVVKKNKYKIKYNGEEKELELDEGELITKLQKAEDYDKKMAKLAEDRRLVEPFRNVIDTEWFKTKLAEGIESGEIEQPRQSEAPSEDAIFGLEKRKLDPDFSRVQEAMRNWAATLPVTMQVQLDSNVVVFNNEYDRIANILREKKQNKTLNLTERKAVDKIIANKEKSKASARLEGAGMESEIPEGNVKARKLKDLKKIMKDGRPAQRDLAAAEYLLATAFGKDE